MLHYHCMGGMMHIAILYGSVREERLGIRAVYFFKKLLEQRNHVVEIIDPLKDKLPLLDKMYKEYDKAPSLLEQLHEKLLKADGYLVVTGEYNHSIPPALKNLIDHFIEEYFFKPSAIVSYSIGSFGGVRAAMSLRVILPEVGMPSIPSIFPVPNISETLDEKGEVINKELVNKTKKFLDEFEWYLEAFKKQRQQGTPY